MDHPNIVTLLGTVRDDSGWAFVFERCDFNFGQLTAPCADGVPEGADLRRCVALFGQLAEALDCLHLHKKVHRDLKPANVLVAVDPETKEEIVKLADFGLTRNVV